MAKRKKISAKKTPDEPKPSSFTVIAPIIISIASLIFGAYQYYDKRHLEIENAILVNQARVLEIKQKGIEIRKEEIQYQSSLEIQYIESEVIGNPLLRKWIIGFNPKLSSNNFDSMLLEWATYLATKLPYPVKLSPLKTELNQEIGNHFLEMDSPYTHVSLFLIRNAGSSSVSDISMDCRKLPEGNSYPINIKQLEPGKGVILVTGISNPKTHEYFDSRLIPGEQIKYFDQFNNQREGVAVREPFKTSMILLDSFTVANVIISPVDEPER